MTTQNGSSRTPAEIINSVINPIRYCTSDGLDFWYDRPTCRIATADPETSLNFVTLGYLNSEMRIYLQMPNLSIQFARSGGEAFSPLMKDSHGKTEWVFGSIGDPLYFNDRLKKFMVHRPPNKNPASSELKSAILAVAIDTCFNSLEQQERALAFVRTVLQKYDGDWIGANLGEAQSASVEYSDDLVRRINAGEFLR